MDGPRRQINHAIYLQRKCFETCPLPLPACMPTAKDASIQTVLKYTNINSLLDESNKSKVSELRLNEVVDALRSKVQERKSNLLLM